MDTSELSPHVQPADLLEAAALCRDTCTPALAADWGVPAGALTWTCRRTLDHIVDTLCLYATYVASRARGRLPIARDGTPALPAADLLRLVEAMASVLAEVARAAPLGTRVYHPAGLADVEGFLAMGCDEILIHTADIARGLRVPFRPPDELAGRVLARLFPWAPNGDAPWDALLWANGRAALVDRPRLDADWYWWCAPLEEWDGAIKKRTAPPAWP
jgi:DinB family protein